MTSVSYNISISKFHTTFQFQSFNIHFSIQKSLNFDNNSNNNVKNVPKYSQLPKKYKSLSSWPKKLHLDCAYCGCLIDSVPVPVCTSVSIEKSKNNKKKESKKLTMQVPTSHSTKVEVVVAGFGPCSAKAVHTGIFRAVLSWKTLGLG